MNLSMRIRVARQRAKLSQEALASLIGVTRGAVANWECSVGATPAFNRLEHLARVTEVSFEWLATGRGQLSLLREDSTLAVDAEIVYDSTERKLLAEFRSADKHAREIAMRLLEQAGRPAKRKRV